LFTASFVDRVKEYLIRNKNKQNFLETNTLNVDEFGISNPDCKESEKNLNDLINNPDIVIFQPSNKISYESEVNYKNILADSIYKIKNNNYKYIYNMLKKNKLKDSSRNPATRYLSGKKLIHKSYLYNLFETIIYSFYINVPYMKFSKQFVNTYTVAFMIVYFFTLFGIKASDLLNNLLVI
jgi:hypothetical protein